MTVAQSATGVACRILFHGCGLGPHMRPRSRETRPSTALPACHTRSVREDTCGGLCAWAYGGTGLNRSVAAVSDRCWSGVAPASIGKPLLSAFQQWRNSRVSTDRHSAAVRCLSADEARPRAEWTSTGACCPFASGCQRFRCGRGSCAATVLGWKRFLGRRLKTRAAACGSAINVQHERSCRWHFMAATASTVLPDRTCHHCTGETFHLSCQGSGRNRSCQVSRGSLDAGRTVPRWSRGQRSVLTCSCGMGSKSTCRRFSMKQKTLPEPGRARTCNLLVRSQTRSL